MTPTRRSARRALTLLFALAGVLTFAPTSPALAAEEEPYVLEIYPTAGSGSGEVTCEYKEEGVKQVVEECEWLEFEAQKSVTLKAVAEKGSEFIDFEAGEGSAEACNGKANPCTFTLKESKASRFASIEARFERIEPTLAVQVTGLGEVICYVNGLPEFCEGEEFEFESQVLIEFVPEEGWEFSKFQEGTGSASACNGLAESCSFFLEEDSTVGALFVPAMHPLTINKVGSGSGTVSCNGTTCAPSYPEETEVTLKATPASGSTFSGWSGEGCSGAGPCVVKIEKSPAAVTATFTANSKPPGPEGPKGSKEGTASVGARAKVRGGRARVRLTCSGGLCKGALKLSARMRRGSSPIVIGRTPFTLASGESTVLPVKLSAAAKRQLQKSGTLHAKAAGTGVVSGSVKLRLTRP